jgi:hypothetical protein
MVRSAHSGSEMLHAESGDDPADAGVEHVAAWRKPDAGGYGRHIRGTPGMAACREACTVTSATVSLHVGTA